MNEPQLDTVAGLEMFVNKLGAGSSNIDESKTTLRCCPFCGHSAGYFESTRAGDKFPLMVICTNTSCAVRTPQHYQSRELAAAAWNRVKGEEAKSKNVLSFQFSSRDLEDISRLETEGFVFDRVVMSDRMGRERRMYILKQMPEGR